jgi:predicted methyltransferase MtxX (methanogen marker protein 4)
VLTRQLGPKQRKKMAAKDKNNVQESASVNRVSVGGVTHTVIQCSECHQDVDVVENDTPEHSLVEKILSKSVPGRDKSTYKCRNGHDADLEVR